MSTDFQNKVQWHDYLIYDPESGTLTWKPRLPEDCATSRACSIWNAKYAGMEAGNIHDDHVNRKRNYITFRSRKYLSHRICWEMHHGQIPAGMTIDHIDQNPLNNSISNLRLATQLEQKRNLPLSSSNSSGTTGVNWCNKTKSWKARIGVHKKSIELGSSKNIEEAIRMRKDAEKLYGFHENHGSVNAANLRAGRKG